SPIQHLHERHASPFGRADGAEAPLLPGDFRLELRAAIACTFKRDHARVRAHVGEIAQAEGERTVHQPAHTQAPDGGIEIWNLKMVAYIKAGVRHHDPADEGGKGRLAIQRMRTMNEQSRVDGPL